MSPPSPESKKPIFIRDSLYNIKKYYFVMYIFSRNTVIESWIECSSRREEVKIGDVCLYDDYLSD